VVADQPGRHFLVLRHRFDHRVDKLVIAVRLVDEALAVREHGDQPWLAAVDDVRVGPDPPVPVGHQRHRTPGDRRGEFGVDVSADGFTQP
jgi:hypothetical protein